MVATRRNKNLLKKIHHRLHPVANRLHREAKTRHNKQRIRHRQRTLKKTLYTMLKKSPPDIVAQVLDAVTDETVVAELLEMAVL
jgi:hypothetical protein